MSTSLMINLLTEKAQLWGSIPQINIMGLLDWFLKNEPMAINP